MHVTIRLRRPGRVPHRRESDRVTVPAGWYDRELPLTPQRVFCPRQTGRLEGGYTDQRDGVAVLFVRVLAVAEGDL